MRSVLVKTFRINCSGELGGPLASHGPQHLCLKPRRPDCVCSPNQPVFPRGPKFPFWGPVLTFSPICVQDRWFAHLIIWEQACTHTLLPVLTWHQTHASWPRREKRKHKSKRSRQDRAEPHNGSRRHGSRRPQVNSDRSPTQQQIRTVPLGGAATLCRPDHWGLQRCYGASITARLSCVCSGCKGSQVRQHLLCSVLVVSQAAGGLHSSAGLTLSLPEQMLPSLPASCARVIASIAQLVDMRL